MKLIFAGLHKTEPYRRHAVFNSRRLTPLLTRRVESHFSSPFIDESLNSIWEDVVVALIGNLKLLMMDKGNGCSFSGVISTATFSCAILVVTLILLRILYIVYWSSRPFGRKATKPVSTLIVLGSGGHTAEMLNLLAVIQKDRFTPRFYVAAATDNESSKSSVVGELPRSRDSLQWTWNLHSTLCNCFLI